MDGKMEEVCKIYAVFIQLLVSLSERTLDLNVWNLAWQALSVINLTECF